MVICKHCKHENHGDVTYCVKCGNWLGPVAEKHSRWEALAARFPLVKRIRESETGYAVLIVCGIVLMILTSIGMTTIEGLASILFIIIGITAFRVFFGRPVQSLAKLLKETIVGIAIFAFFGACLDQTGNAIYNKPIGYINCPADTSLQRTTIVTNPLPDSTYFIQNFTCYARDGKPVHEVNLLSVLAVRVFEYLALGLLLVLLRWLVGRIKMRVREQ